MRYLRSCKRYYIKFLLYVVLVYYLVVDYKNILLIREVLTYKSNIIRAINYYSIYLYKKNIFNSLVGVYKEDLTYINNLIEEIYRIGLINKNTYVSYLYFIRGIYNNKLLRISSIYRKLIYISSSYYIYNK